MKPEELTTRERIIQQSAELFNTYGYHGCSLSHIMEATKLKKGGIYNHFRNKDEIAVEAFNYNYNRVLKRFRDRLDQDKTSFDKLNSVIDVFVSLIEDPMVKGGGCPIFNTAMDSTNTHPELKEKAREGIKGLTRYVKIKLQEGIEAGEFRDDTDVRVVATLLVATLEGAIIMSRVNDDYACIELASDYLKNYIREKILISPPALSKTDGYNPQYLKPKEKNLRDNLTPAEATLWNHLKGGQLEGRKFYQKHSVGNYTLGFYCPEENLAVELDGEDDKHRDENLTKLGIRVLRFENIEIFKSIEMVLDEIRAGFTASGLS